MAQLHATASSGAVFFFPRDEVVVAQTFQEGGLWLFLLPLGIGRFS